MNEALNFIIQVWNGMQTNPFVIPLIGMLFVIAVMLFGRLKDNGSRR